MCGSVPWRHRALQLERIYARAEGLETGLGKVSSANGHALLILLVDGA